jgi:transporter family protein
MNWLGYALLSALFAGLVAIFGKIGVREVDSTLATAARAVIMALALVILVLTRSKAMNLGQISSRAWVFITLAGMAGAASWLCYFRALQLGNASQIAPVDRLSVLIVVVFAALFLGEKITGGVAVGALMVLAGSIIIARG